ncbi:MAG: endolytic transglycosylase MltG [Acidobacteria bacterium]|nr:endolytic transglycosylase MltG [Acidobacteriota bacterium]MBK7935322.1 endolytic transglycosylase MltG [Acidobacteriota bacterium]
MKFIKIIFVLLILAVIAVSGFSYWVYSSVNASREHSKAAEYIKIEKGTSPRDIISQLADAGIVASPAATMLYLRTVGDASKLQAGEYQFPSPINTLQVLKILEKGEDRTIKLTIPEGFTRFDIAKRIAEKFPQTPPIDDKAILTMMDDVTLIRDISPTAKNLEGYMYPTTYNLPRDAKPNEIIKRMVDEFRKFWKPEWTQQAQSIGRTPHEIVTIASLIETETGVENERPIVAGIINNRLAKNIPLGIDQTNVYIAKMLGKWDGTIHKSDLEVDSPYNTRIKTGIPPGPISSVTESSIRAALNPSPNDFIFYVRNVELNDGSHWFYASAADFEKGKAKYQEWLEKERQEKRSNDNNQ